MTMLSEKLVNIAFAGISPDILHASIAPSGIAVLATIDGELCDMLFDFDIEIERGMGGYFCTFCDPESRQVHDSREMLWREHLFAGFLTWVNTELCSAQALRLVMGDGYFWASLIRDLEMPIENDPNYQLTHALQPLASASQETHTRKRSLTMEKIRLIPFHR